ncbi:hypothetical protein [Rubricoccus marinus]|uniref:Uncharacterized protein n=1 Tax=Rubricoccus marinus TaxID=716817 RepID=A0A259U2K1_9BACT|nr:hypothetical protein [Rubricoccus marinus]OZC04024.1 hypothetical protein BSZ36_14150 [Rubricoccus marinus]
MLPLISAPLAALSVALYRRARRAEASRRQRRRLHRLGRYAALSAAYVVEPSDALAPSMAAARVLGLSPDEACAEAEVFRALNAAELPTLRASGAEIPLVSGGDGRPFLAPPEALPDRLAVAWLRSALADTILSATLRDVEGVVATAPIGGSASVRARARVVGERGTDGRTVGGR